MNIPEKPYHQNIKTVFLVDIELSIKYGYCYNCHWKREQVEEIELRDNLKDFYVSLSKAIKDIDSQKVPSQQDVAKDLDQRLERWGTHDVLGQPAGPLCTYYRRHHKFSLTVLDDAGGKYPMNKTLGIRVKYL